MSQVVVSQTVFAPLPRVWKALENFGQVYLFHPRVARSPILNATTHGVGARRQCEFHDGNKVVEELVALEHGKSMTVDIIEGSMPLKRARAHISLAEEDGGTRVTFDMQYDPKYGLLGKLMDVTMMRRQFTKILGEVITGLDTHIRTGGEVGQDGKTQPRAAA